MFIYNGQRFDINAEHRIGGVTYPAGWFRDPASRAALGIIEVAEQPRPDDSLYWVTDNGDGTYTATERDIADLRAKWRSDLAARRYAVETGGAVINAIPFATDPVSQTKIVGAAVAAMLDPLLELKWKTETGFVDLDAATITAVAQAVRAHVQAAFDNEAALAAQINAATTLAELQAIDLSAGWPANPEANP